MHIYFINGRRIWIENAQEWDIEYDGTMLVIYAKRKEWIAQFVLTQVLGWHYGGGAKNEADVTTYGFASEPKEIGA